MLARPTYFQFMRRVLLCILNGADLWFLRGFYKSFSAQIGMQNLTPFCDCVTCATICCCGCMVTAIANFSIDVKLMWWILFRQRGGSLQCWLHSMYPSRPHCSSLTLLDSRPCLCDLHASKGGIEKAAYETELITSGQSLSNCGKGSPGSVIAAN